MNDLTIIRVGDLVEYSSYPNIGLGIIIDSYIEKYSFSKLYKVYWLINKNYHKKIYRYTEEDIKKLT